MQAMVYRTPKAEILKKLKEIGMDKQEDRKSPDNEMERVVKREDIVPGTETKYFKTIYGIDDDGQDMANHEQQKNISKPSEDVKEYTEEHDTLKIQ